MKKSTFWEKTEKFLAGKGFYIVLSACALVIGVSAWIMIAGSADMTVPDDAVSVSQTVTGLEPVAETKPTLQQPVSTPSRERETVPVSVPAEPKQTQSDRELEQLQRQEDESEHAPEPTAAQQPVQQTAQGYVWPVGGQIVVEYSPDTLIYSKTMADWRTHPGLDLAADIGTKVLCVAQGTVEKVYDDDLYGTTLVIDHGGGLRSVYSNLAGQPTVAAGDSVAMGAVIGAVGDTALAETVEVAHLHFAMTRDGEPIDPASILPQQS